MKPPYPTLLFCLAVVLCLWGCATPKKPPPPPLVLGLVGKEASAEALLHAVIVPGGPDSWIKEAFWDEYVVTFSNQGSSPLSVEAVCLEDPLGAQQSSMGKPEDLGKKTVENWKAYRKGNVPVTKENFETSVPAAVATPLLVAALVVNPADLILLPFAMVSLSNDQKKIQSEFAQRNLVFPLVLEPGTKAMGSLFFPMTAAPRRLIVKARCEDRAVEVVIPLTALSQLHLATKS